LFDLYNPISFDLEVGECVPYLLRRYKVLPLFIGVNRQPPPPNACRHRLSINSGVATSWQNAIDSQLRGPTRSFFLLQYNESLSEVSAVGTVLFKARKRRKESAGILRAIQKHSLSHESNKKDEKSKTEEKPTSN